MKVLYVNAMGATTKNPAGGIFVSQRINALRQLGVEVIPVSLKIEYSRLTKIMLKLRGIEDSGQLLSCQRGICYQLMSVHMNLKNTFFARMDSSIYNKIFQRSIVKELCKFQDIDLIHLHWCWPMGIAVYDLAKKLGIPYVLTFHGSDINIQLKMEHVRSAMLEIMENAASVEFISNALQKEAIFQGFSGKNSIIIYNGIDTEVFYKRERKNKIKKIGFVGNLIEIKGADRLPAILKGIKSQYHDEIEFVIIGKGKLAENIKNETVGLPVFFKGQLPPEELAQEYSQMDILIVPSRMEGYPCVIKEAQACGVVPIGNDVGGIREAIGEYGVVVTAMNEKNLVSSFVTHAVELLEGKKQIDVDEMMREAVKCSWVEKQKVSKKNYENILLNIKQ